MAELTLLVDLGNTRFKWVTCAQGGLSEPCYQVRSGAREVTALVQAWQPLEPSRIVVASVLDKAFENRLAAEVSRELGVCVEWVRVPAAGHGIRVAYTDPAQLGVDRFVAMVGAREHQCGACVIVDCGTAVTIDALDESGRHRGGLILPGPGLMRKALCRGTAGIGATGRRQESGLFARDTETAISGGVIRTVAAAIDHISGDMGQILGAETVRILTGGDGEQILPLLGGRYCYDPVLTLRGLAAMSCRER